MTNEKLFTIKEVIEDNHFQISERTLRRMIDERKIKVKRIGSGRGMIRIPESELEKLAKLD
jgi:excisionase family DNA binding protein